jgi:ribosomal protein S6
MSTTEDRELVVYELGYLLLPSIPEDKLGDAVDTIKKIVTKAGGQVLDGEDPFLIELAYDMHKVVGAVKHIAKDAYIGWFKFESEPKDISSIDTELKNTGEVLRHLLVKAPRETAFTFAKAREAMKKLELPEEGGTVAVPLVEEAATEPAVEPKADVLE